MVRVRFRTFSLIKDACLSGPCRALAAAKAGEGGVGSAVAPTELAGETQLPPGSASRPHTARCPGTRAESGPWGSPPGLPLRTGVLLALLTVTVASSRMRVTGLNLASASAVSHDTREPFHLILVFILFFILFCVFRSCG